MAGKKQTPRRFLIIYLKKEKPLHEIARKEILSIVQLKGILPFVENGDININDLVSFEKQLLIKVGRKIARQLK